MPDSEIGKVTHYFGKISVAAIEITQGTLRVGDDLEVVGLKAIQKTTCTGT